MDAKGYEVIEKYTDDGELDGFVVVEAPTWYRMAHTQSPVDYSDRDYDRLVATNPEPLSDVWCCRTCCWAAWVDA